MNLFSQPPAVIDALTANDGPVTLETVISVLPSPFQAAAAELASPFIGSEFPASPGEAPQLHAIRFEIAKTFDGLLSDAFIGPKSPADRTIWKSGVQTVRGLVLKALPTNTFDSNPE